jgi:hypothetical protein
MRTDDGLAPRSDGLHASTVITVREELQRGAAAG